jgi:predicted GTPase
MREHCPHIPCILVANKIDGKKIKKEYFLFMNYKLKKKIFLIEIKKNFIFFFFKLFS